MTPFARYVHLLDRILAQRIPDDPEARRMEARKLHREGMRIYALSERFNVSRQTMRTWLTSDRRAFRHTAETKARYAALRASGLSTRKAAAELGLCRATVWNWEGACR